MVPIHQTYLQGRAGTILWEFRVLCGPIAFEPHQPMLLAKAVLMLCRVSDRFAAPSQSTEAEVQVGGVRHLTSKSGSGSVILGGGGTFG